MSEREVGVTVGVAAGKVVGVSRAFVPSTHYYHARPGGWRVVYVYSVDGVEYTQCDYEEEKTLSQGQPVDVFYLITRPDVSRLGLQSGVREQ